MVLNWLSKSTANLYGRLKRLFWRKKKTKTQIIPEVTEVTEEEKEEVIIEDDVTHYENKQKQKKKKVPTMNREDVRSIITLYDKVDGENWKFKDSWRSTLPVKQWFGIVVVESRITELCLSANSLKGILPPELGSLLGLRKLELNENALIGDIPSSLSKLMNLEYIDLSHNSLSGEIPSELFDIPTLSHVYLQRNKLSGCLPKTISTNPSLEVLCLEHNDLKGEPPFQWDSSKLTLKELHLHGNHFIDNSLARTRLTCELGPQCEVSV